jgi:catechol 2,3-dioxygenase-like lactoylglutathione lyase family enzyme
MIHAPAVDRVHVRISDVPMLNHISIGVASLSRAKAFYDAALSALGYRCLSQDAGSLGYGDKCAEFWVYKAEKPVPEDSHSGLHICFTGPTHDSVDQFHAGGLRHGGRDNGQPGLRPDYGPGYYAAFLKDPDGYRIEAYCSAEP